MSAGRISKDKAARFPRHASSFLKERGIGRELAKRAELRYADAKEAAALVGPPIDRHPDGSVVTSDAIIIPHGEAVAARWLNPDAKPKYKNQPGSTNSFYLVPFLDWHRLAKNPSKPLILTEGQFKAIKGCDSGFDTIALTGVYNWLSDGRPIKDFDAFVWKDRTVIICFDSDVVQKQQVQQALRRLSEHLMQLGATVLIKVLPAEPDGCKNGIDDYIVRYGPKAFGALPELPYDHPQFAEWGAHPATVELNRKLCMVPIEGAAYVLVESQHDRFPAAKQYDLVSPQKLAPLYANQLHQIGTKGKREPKPIKATALDIWMRDPNRREAQKVTFAPGLPAGLDRETRIFNLWQGYGVKPVMPDASHSWKRLQEHIHEVAANSNVRHAHYILNWMAWCIQNPEKRPEVALVFLGAEGTGKGTVCRAFVDLHGPHGVQLTQRNQLTGNFNAHLKDILAVCADESFYAGDHEANSALKSIITEPTKMIEPKGVNAFVVPNFTRLLMTSNSDWVINAAAGSRRYAVFEVASTRVGQIETWFEPLNAELRNGGYEAMFYDLLHRDVRSFDPRDLPKTGALFKQKVLSLSAVERWWYERLKEGSLPAKRGGSTVAVICEPWSERTWMDRRLVHEHIEQHAGLTLTERRSLETSVGIWLPKMCAGIRPERRSIMNQQVRGYAVPSLTECRASFEKYCRVEPGTIAWDE